MIPAVQQQSERILIMQTATSRSLEYKNAFLYVVIREETGAARGSYVFYSGINTRWFCRLSWKKAGICSNPAVRGIQLLRTHVSRFAAEHDMIADKAEGIDLFAMAPGGDGWWNEDPLRIEGASPEQIRELLEFSVMDLVRTVLVVCVPGAQIPVAFLDEASMQKFLESLSVVEERERVMADERESHTGAKVGRGKA
jgi:hypothetical protein